jgi:hypothetical protein
MSATGKSNADTSSVLRLFTAQQDSRITLSRSVKQVRKATRYRASTVVTTHNPSIMRPLCFGSSWEMNMDGGGSDAGLCGDRSQHSFKAGGAVRISDMHK